MCSAPNFFTPSPIIRCTSASTATSPATATACPPAASTFLTVSAAAACSMSATTILPPSSAKSTAAARPIPAPAPVMNATFPRSRSAIPPTAWRSDQNGPDARRRRCFERGLWPPPRPPSTKRCRWMIFIAPLYALEVTNELPVRDCLIQRLLLQARRVQVMFDDPLAKRRPRHLRALELGDRLPQGLRHLRQRRVVVGVALVRLGRLQLALDTVQAGGDGGGKRQVRVRIGAGNPVLDTERRVVAAQPEAAGAIVPADGNAGRREGARLVTLVRVDAGRVEVRELARHGQLPGQPLPEQRRGARTAIARTRRREERLGARPIPQRRVKVTRGAGGAHVVLRHERQRASLEVRDLLGAVLVERGAIRHLERLGVDEVDFLLSPPPLTLGRLHRDVGLFHPVADGAHERLFLRRLQNMIVLEVVRDRSEERRVGKGVRT